MINLYLIQRTNSDIYSQAENSANKLFGKECYAKNLWIHQEYTRLGGQSIYPENNRSKSRTNILYAAANHLLHVSNVQDLQNIQDQTVRDNLQTDLQYLAACDCYEDEIDYLEEKWSPDPAIAAKEKKVLNKPFRTPGGPKKFSVYVKNDKGNIVKVNFGDPNMEIKRDDPNRRKSFRARHNCENPGPKWKARYWSCRQWRSSSPVEASDAEMLKIMPELANAESSSDE